MNTLARSLDALIGPARSKRGRKRDFASIDDGDVGPERASKAIYKRLRMMTALDDAARGRREGSVTGIASFASSIRPVPGPVQQINQLAAQQQPLETLNFSGLEACTLPPSMDVLVAKVRRCAKGIDTIPASLKTQVLERDPDLLPDDNVWQPEAPLLAENVPPRLMSNADEVTHLEVSDKVTSQPSQDNALSSQTRNRLLYFPQAEMIVDQARECNDNDDLEAGWNSHVHGPLLLLACNMSKHRTKVKSINLTQARILARLEPASQAVSAGQMVDFGIYLQNSDNLRAAYREIEPEADGQSRYFNHTDCEQIARKPLAISVETQREGQRGSQADLQLGLWAKSHLNRLSELRGRELHPDDRTIWLPLLKVVGPVWYLLLARGDYDDWGELSSTAIFSRHQLGDVSTYHGFFQVLSALLGIIDWTETCYRPWFEDWVSNGHVVEEDAA